MILQRDAATKVWGTGAKAGAQVKVSVNAPANDNLETATTLAAGDGSWSTTLNVSATLTATLTATDGASTATLKDVAFGDVLLCGGQSNSECAASHVLIIS